MASITHRRNAVLGAAFLMATSAIGPGFLTQTATFTNTLLASFGFVILLSILLDIGAQLNIWRIVIVSGKRAQDISNAVFPKAGYFLAALIVMGGLAFNIGNVGGAGLGLNSIFGIAPEMGAVISGIIAILIFLRKEAGLLMDRFAQLMGFIMVALTFYVMFKTEPPVAEAAYHSFIPEQIDPIAIVTLVGGTVGGYITFAGAHRLLDAGIQGEKAMAEVSRSSVSAILIASTMRVVLFLAVLGVVSKGVSLNPKNPAETPFENFGQVLFGVVIWAASVTSVIGAAYTSVSFLTTLCPTIERNRNRWIIAFIVISTVVLVTVGKPAAVLVFVGTLNGLILPIALALILLAAYRSDIVGTYKHPVFLAFSGWFVVIIMAILSGKTIISYISSFFS
ncbi:NRAMP family divalent metal transporter [Haemophilus influenzae]|uniref:NRAMP family divalent metal transporter n=1 Tax=Haemophilus influenzae TaxID=727 RepID=UPI00270882E3|nr:NRAMP family divalent metal transporter [Haemophilus influenzae]MDO7264907.1 divalent metal cation transporter [Haemophilus influenzae]